MNAIGKQYYKVNAYFLLTIGLWPYTSKKLRRISNVLVSLFLCLGVIIQLATFVTYNYTMELFLRNLSPICLAAAGAFKYHWSWFHLDNMRELLEQIKHDWNTLNVEEELTIIKHHAEVGKYYIKIFALFLYPASFGFIVCILVSDFVNVVISSNESRQHQFPIMFEAIVDQQKYYYLLVIFLIIILFATVTTFVALEGLSFMILQHAAGMFDIASYRIKEAIVSDFVKEKDFSKELDARKFASAMKMHTRALVFQKCINRKFAPPYLVLLVIAIVTLSINMYRLSRALNNLADTSELLFSGFMVPCQFGCIYQLNFMVSKVLDSANNIFNELYNTKWYEAPVYLQKLLLFAMVVNVKPAEFIICGVYDVSIEGSSMMMRAAISYFMVLQSVQ